MFQAEKNRCKGSKEVDFVLSEETAPGLADRDRVAKSCFFSFLVGLLYFHTSISKAVGAAVKNLGFVDKLKWVSVPALPLPGCLGFRK